LYFGQAVLPEGVKGIIMDVFMSITILLAIATVIATFIGGLLALRFKDKLHLILGFSAGAVIGVAFFDLLPEAIELGGSIYDVDIITSVVAAGFVFFMILDRMVLLHTHEEDADHSHGENIHRGRLGALSLAVHSFLDGVAIGLAFHVSSAVGAVVATAVLVHDFSDGINTVNLILKNQGKSKHAFSWLVVVALAPLLGAFSTFFFTLSEASLGLVLATFCGFFLYIGAADLLPESHHSHPTKWPTLMTILGVAVLYVAIRLAHS
jgi:ZIP family zinc transporter